MKRTLIGFVAVAFCMAGVAFGQHPDRAKEFYRCQLHRGAGNALPDNTLQAFLWAWGHGVTPEADARLTKDGVAIAFHDNNLRRLARGIPFEMRDKPLWEANWADIRDVDIGSYMGPQYDYYRIPTMDAVFAAMKGCPERLLYLDEKGATPELMAKMSAEYGVQEQVFFCSSRYELLPQWKKLAPKGRTMHWMGSWAKNNSPEEIARTEKYLQEKLDALEKIGFKDLDQVQIHVRTDFSKADPFCPSSAFLKKAGEMLHKHGVRFQSISWSEGDTPETYKRLWALGVDSFATDYPAALFAARKDLK